ncbi:MAG: UvrD-helicase domain-containing protein [Bacillota bacterium]
MGDFHENMRVETAYLDKTLAVIRREVEMEAAALAERKSELIALRKEMYENTVHFTNDFTRLTEINQYLSEANYKAASYSIRLKRAEIYRSMISSPYFGRFDFAVDGTTTREKVYVGLHNVIDPKEGAILVYDWRAPISGVFYRYEPGRASYTAPAGEIPGEVLLKRQYKIKDSRLKYFFDCSIRINDEILQQVLSGHASAKMRNIVETIQREQDAVIRDTENELLIVQGVAGSGKTSVALHRVAFLLYEGLNSKLGSNNVIVISPNAVFSRYISGVLPELGEENIERTTFEDIAGRVLGGRIAAETRNEQLECLIGSRNSGEGVIRRQSIEFKGSRTFTQILERLIRHFKRHMVPFKDVYFDGKTLFTGQQLKNLFLNDRTGAPAVKLLKRIEKKILEAVRPLQKQRLEKIEQIVKKNPEHQLEIKSFSRLLAMKENRRFAERLHRFTEIDYLDLYKLLFNDRELLNGLARGLELPGAVEEIISRTRDCLEKGRVEYEDCAPVLYLKLRLEGSGGYPEIRQVVVDEAQDYYPLQYEVFNLLFGDARYTVLGDVHQAVEKDEDPSLYNVVSDIFRKSRTVKIFLNKSYRASFEINAFTNKLLDNKPDLVPFERHEAEPVVVSAVTPEALDAAVERDIAFCLEEGCESVAVICKTRKEAEQLYEKLSKSMDITLIGGNEDEIGGGALVIPVYLAKGLEFDAVLVYGVSRDNYAGELDRRLLYVACTRALHRLTLYYTGEISPFIAAAVDACTNPVPAKYYVDN